MARLPSKEEVSRASAAFEPYFAAVGRVVHAWNHLQDQLGIVFCRLTDLDDETGLSIWHANPNDGAQRKMLRAVVNANERRRQALIEAGEEPPPKFPSNAAEDLNWLLEKADKVADRRNNAVHAPCTIALASEDEFEIRPASGMNPRARKLRGRQVLSEFAWYEQTARVLQGYARGIDIYLTLDGYAWPDRPPLPSPRHTDTPTPRRGSHVHPPRSSRA